MELAGDERNLASQTGKLQPFFRMTAFSASPCRLNSSVLTAQIRRLHSSLMLLQYPDDLLFRIPALLHLTPLAQFTRELQFRPPVLDEATAYREEHNGISSDLRERVLSTKLR